MEHPYSSGKWLNEEDHYSFEFFKNESIIFCSIHQIPCHSQYKAVPGCLQTYAGTEGVIESFNYRGIPRGIIQ